MSLLRIMPVAGKTFGQTNRTDLLPSLRLSPFSNSAFFSTASYRSTMIIMSAAEKCFDQTNRHWDLLHSLRLSLYLIPQYFLVKLTMSNVFINLLCFQLHHPTIMQYYLPLYNKKSETKIVCCELEKAGTIWESCFVLTCTVMWRHFRATNMW